MMIDYYVTFGIGRKTMIMSRWRNGPGVGGEDTGTTGIEKFLCTVHSTAQPPLSCQGELQLECET